MQAKRLGLYLGCAAIVAGAAYFFGPALSTSPASPGRVAKSDGKGRTQPPAPVTVATVVERDMPVILSAPGTVEALATVAVKPRVDGQIVQVAFKEGDLVEDGSVLFRLDDRIAKAQIAQAEAGIAKDEASLRDAEATLARRRALIDKQVVSEAQLDQARFAVEGLKAGIAAGRAQLDSQKTLLDYLTIRAPITGRTGGLNAKLGATVRAQDATALVTINQTRPILVAFSLPQGDLPALRRALDKKAQAKITVPGTREPAAGTIAFIDNQVDRQTGTIVVKVVAENDDEMLWPGQSVDVGLTVEVKPRMLAAPAGAVQPAQQGMITWVVDASNKVTPRVVTVERIVDQTVFLSSGVAAGDRVVTDGQLRLAPGATVVIEEPRRAPPAPPSGDERRPAGRG
jgi:multidrug efflux system membrane fusion protein